MLIWLLIVLNFFICAWDSYAAGILWSTNKTINKLISICAITIGSIGMLYTFIIVGVATNYLNSEWLIASNVILGAPLILAGIVVTINGWYETIKNRSVLSGIISIWNTFAIIWDIKVWIESFKILKDTGFGNLFSSNSGNSKDKAILFILISAIITAFISVGLFRVGKNKNKNNILNIQ